MFVMCPSFLVSHPLKGDRYQEDFHFLCLCHSQSIFSMMEFSHSCCCIASSFPHFIMPPRRRWFSGCPSVPFSWTWYFRHPLKEFDLAQRVVERVRRVIQDGFDFCPSSSSPSLPPHCAVPTWSPNRPSLTACWDCPAHHREEQSAGYYRLIEDLQEPVAHTEGSESPQEEQSALPLPEEGFSAVSPVHFFIDLDPKILIWVHSLHFLLPSVRLYSNVPICKCTDTTCTYHKLVVNLPYCLRKSSLSLWFPS